MIGIYKVEIGKSLLYIGQSKDIRRRFYEHKSMLLNKKHTNRYLQNVCNKYGYEKLKFSVIEVLLPENLCQREAYWIKELKPRCNLMVVRDGDGTLHTEEWKLNMSINNPSKRPDVKILRSEHMKKHNPMNNASSRKKMSESQKIRISKNGHPWVGRKHTDETKLKISLAQKARLAKIKV